MPAPFRLLTQGEIEVLRWLARVAGHGRTVTLSARQRKFIAPLWRMGLVEVWSRLMPFDEPQPPGLYFSLSLSGWHRAQPFLASRRGAKAPRTSTVLRTENNPHE
ncbi:MAG: hypothetical protein ACRECA_07420 [Pseudolabrys sp.]